MFGQEKIPVGSKFSHSTSYCEILGVYFSNTNLPNITVYRPPDATIEHFNEVLTKAKEWISELEKAGINPIILINGDLNF